MSQLERADLHAAIETRFPDNTTEDITPEQLRDGLHELVDSAFITATDTGAVPNVPAYRVGTTYAVGYTVRYTPPGGQAGFYYSLNAGRLTAPGPSNTTDWKVVPGPVTPTALSQALTLVQAQGIEGDAVVAGRSYCVDFGPDAQGHAQTITLIGVSNNSFSKFGTLEINGQRWSVDNVDVFAGTWVTLTDHIAAITGTNNAVIIYKPDNTIEVRPTVGFSLYHAFRDLPSTSIVRFNANRIALDEFTVFSPTPGAVSFQAFGLGCQFVGLNMANSAVFYSGDDVSGQVSLHHFDFVLDDTANLQFNAGQLAFRYKLAGCNFLHAPGGTAHYVDVNGNVTLIVEDCYLAAGYHFTTYSAATYTTQIILRGSTNGEVGVGQMWPVGTLDQRPGASATGSVPAAALEAVRATIELAPAHAADFTLALADAGRITEVASSSAVTVTVPGSGDVAYALGTQLTLCQAGPGQVTLAAAYGVNLLCNSAAGLKTAGQWLDIILRKRDRDTWVVTNGIQ